MKRFLFNLVVLVLVAVTLLTGTGIQPLLPVGAGESPTLTVNVSPENAGAVMINNYFLTSTTYYLTTEYNSEVNLFAFPLSGYTFQGWAGSIVTSDNPTVITMNRSKNVTAVFAENLGTISGTVWLDNNGNGSREPWENGVPGIMVLLYQNAFVTNVTVTGAGGDYEFFDTVTDAYSIRFIPPAAYSFCPAGEDSQTDYWGSSEQFVLTAGGAVTISAGIYAPFNKWFIFEQTNGWNSVSFPYPLNSGTPTLPGVIREGFSLQTIYGYRDGEWNTYSPVGPTGSLGDFSDGEGYLFLNTHNWTYYFLGVPMPPFPEVLPAYTYRQGWNLVGVTSAVPIEAGTYFSNIAGKYAIVYGVENESYYVVNDSDILYPGRAYWVAMTEAVTLYPSMKVVNNITVEGAGAMATSQQANPAFSILDVRKPGEYTSGHLPGAINLNYYDADFTQQLSALDKQGIYLVYCGSGARSGKAMMIMHQMGFQQVYNMYSGYAAWQDAGNQIPQPTPTTTITATPTTTTTTPTIEWPG